MKNYYELLEVQENASQEIIEKAYKTLAKKYHPDSQGNDCSSASEAHFKSINEAYFVLSDPEKRIVYDFENGFADVSTNYEEKYNNLYAEQERLKNELNALRGNPPDSESNNNTSNNQKAKKKNSKTQSPLNVGFFKSTLRQVANGIYNETKKSNLDRPKNLKALLYTIIIMIALLLIFWNVPFIRNFLFP